MLRNSRNSRISSRDLTLIYIRFTEITMANEGEGVKVQHYCSREGCENQSKLQCPTCLKQGIEGSYFCSQVRALSFMKLFNGQLIVHIILADNIYYVRLSLSVYYITSIIFRRIVLKMCGTITKRNIENQVFTQLN